MWEILKEIGHYRGRPPPFLSQMGLGEEIFGKYEEICETYEGICAKYEGVSGKYEGMIIWEYAKNMKK